MQDQNLPPSQMHDTMKREDVLGHGPTLESIQNEVDQLYIHSEDLYQKTHKLMEVFRKVCHVPQNLEEAILMLGKTGSGKSTFINFLNDVELIVSDGKLNPKNEADAIAKIGLGYDSTTFVPSAYQTRFGNFFDLPGDGDTGGMVIEIMNCLMKKAMAQNLKRVKLVVMLPYQYFTAQGSYGSSLKDLLEANNKFFQDINRYKSNTIFVVSFVMPNNKVDGINNSIDTYLRHQDQKLKKFQQLIKQVKNSQRIKLFAFPTGQDGGYEVPSLSHWAQHTKEKIREQITNMPCRECTQDDFSVPYNIEVELIMKKVYLVVINKIKNLVEQAFGYFQFSGLELQYAQQLLTALKTKKTLENFIDLCSESSFIPDNLSLENQDFKQIYEEAKFVKQFISDGPDQIQQKWISDQLELKLNKILSILNILIHEKGGDFRKGLKSEELGLKIRPNNRLFAQIYQMFQVLYGMYKKKEAIQENRDVNTSQFYEEYMEKVFDRIGKKNFDIKESYVEFQMREKTVEVPKCVEYDIPFTRDKVEIRKEEEKYKQNVPKVRQVQKTAQVQVGYEKPLGGFLGGLVTGIFGITRSSTRLQNFNYTTNQIEMVEEEKTRIVDRVYKEEVTDYVKGTKVEYETKIENESVPIQKERTVTKEVDQNLFKEEKMKKFDEQKFNLQMAQIISEIQSQLQMIRQSISLQSEQYQGQNADTNDRFARDIYEQNYEELLQKFYNLECKTFRSVHQGKRYQA